MLMMKSNVWKLPPSTKMKDNVDCQPPHWGLFEVCRTQMVTDLVFQIFCLKSSLHRGISRKFPVGGFEIHLFSPALQEMIQFDLCIFFEDGLVKSHQQDSGE